MISPRLKKFHSIIVTGIVLVAAVLPVVVGNLAKAATLDNIMVRFDRMATSEPTTGTICAEPATADTETSVQVTFPTGYTLGNAATFTVDTTNTAWPSGASAWVGINTANDVTLQVVTFPSGDLVVGTVYCFNWTNSAAVSIKASATTSNSGTVTTRNVVPATIDTGSFSTASIDDDQIVVSATVPQSFSFELNANSDSLGILSSGSVATSPTPRTVTVDTNAKNGWMVWARDSNTGLNSSSAAHTISSTTPGINSTLSAGTEGYNTGITTSQVGGTGTVSVALPFVGTGAGQGGGLDTALRTLATSNGTADTAVLTVKNNAAISAITPAAADYTDTITIVGAGLF